MREEDSAGCLPAESFTLGVSAGACNGLYYMSGQRGRARSSNIDLIEKLYDYDAYFANPDKEQGIQKENGRIIVIRPERPVEVGRYEIASKMISDSVITR